MIHLPVSILRACLAVLLLSAAPLTGKPAGEPEPASGSPDLHLEEAIAASLASNFS